jgi:hypothetical protein
MISNQKADIKAKVAGVVGEKSLDTCKSLQNACFEYLLETTFTDTQLHGRLFQVNTAL